jgi:hypothetical protein
MIEDPERKRLQQLVKMKNKQPVKVDGSTQVGHGKSIGACV